MSLVKKIALWTILTVFVVRAAIPDGESIRKASFAYRKKAGTVDSSICSANYTCTLQKGFCAAFYIGEGFYVTAAHCLVDDNGRTISDPNRLDIIGAGIVNVILIVNKSYSQPNGVDIAWMVIHDPLLDSDILKLARSTPEKCISYELELTNTNSNDIHSGFRWVQQPEMADSGLSIDLNPCEQGMTDKTGSENVMFCNSKERPDEFGLRFMCGKIKTKNMYSSLQANLTLAEEEQPIARWSRSSGTKDTSASIDFEETPFDSDMTEDNGSISTSNGSSAFHTAFLENINSSHLRDESGMMNMSVLSDAFEDSFLSDPSENVSHQSQITNDRYPSELTKEQTPNSQFGDNVQRSITRNSPDPLHEASYLNPVYNTLPSYPIPISGTEETHSPVCSGQIGKCCRGPMTTTTRKPPPATPTGSLNVVNQSCEVSSPTPTPQFNRSGELLDQVEAEMELRRKKALRKILVHLLRGRNEATPNAMSGSMVLVLVAIGLVMLIMVI